GTGCSTCQRRSSPGTLCAIAFAISCCSAALNRFMTYLTPASTAALVAIATVRPSAGLPVTDDVAAPAVRPGNVAITEQPARLAAAQTPSVNLAKLARNRITARLPSG